MVEAAADSTSQPQRRRAESARTRPRARPRAWVSPYRIYHSSSYQPHGKRVVGLVEEEEEEDQKEAEEKEGGGIAVKQLSPLLDSGTHAHVMRALRPLSATTTRASREHAMTDVRPQASEVALGAALSLRVRSLSLGDQQLSNRTSSLTSSISSFSPPSLSPSFSCTQLASSSKHQHHLWKNKPPVLFVVGQSFEAPQSDKQIWGSVSSPGTRPGPNKLQRPHSASSASRHSSLAETTVSTSSTSSTSKLPQRPHSAAAIIHQRRSTVIEHLRPAVLQQNNMTFIRPRPQSAEPSVMKAPVAVASWLARLPAQQAGISQLSHEVGGYSCGAVGALDTHAQSQVSQVHALAQAQVQAHPYARAYPQQQAQPQPAQAFLQQQRPLTPQRQESLPPQQLLQQHQPQQQPAQSLQAQQQGVLNVVCGVQAVQMPIQLASSKSLVTRVPPFSAQRPRTASPVPRPPLPTTKRPLSAQPRTATASAPVKAVDVENDISGWGQTGADDDRWLDWS